MAERLLMLSKLCAGLGSCLRDAKVTDIVTDSRSAGPGSLFVAVPGYTHNGTDFVSDAVARGASAILAGQELHVPEHVGLAVVGDVRAVLGVIAKRFFGTDELGQRTLAVTGTNGKTSTVRLLAQLLKTLDQAAATVGTLGFQLPTSCSPTRNTTPDVVETHRFLASAAAQNVRWVALEASSHGLAQHRLAGLSITTAAVTNITQDHLDYHGTMVEYIAAKAKILELPELRTVVLDLDDPEVRALRDRVSPDLQVIGFTLGHVAGADVAVVADYHAEGTRATVRLKGCDYRLELPLVGEFYLRNTLTALLMLWSEGLSFDELVAAAGRLQGVAGRLERVGAESDIAVFVDYAHTPDAITRVLQVVRPTVQNDLWVVFGCGGDRDTSKRSLMGKAAATGADWVVLTSDNPRSEDPSKILGDIQTGCPNARLVIEDREVAIKAAIASALPGDTLVIAGKGHETEQIIGDIAYPFSDVDVAQAALALRKCA
jgi:UDP-N-acetylmuramyl-tripeptide synthetase